MLGNFGFSFFGIMFSVPLLVWLLSKVIKTPCKELLENPLPDGKYAGKIIMIEDGKDNEEVYNTLN